ncbi:uncharacterized protein Dwil_GK15490 [Drosophila willistoni]|uniref:Uncharacterized protein n=1 Tax=Drosophila willistoni TaxID=7260 RepID=B4MVF0_DROWI|nr:uncharacterized protein Dwil_GK15490 [Drosophila willistoni]
MGRIFDEDFECMRRMAQGICQTLRRPKDRELCQSILNQLTNFQQVESVAVKKNVRKFMSFYLKVLRWAQKYQPIAVYRQWYGDSFRNDVSTAAGNPGEIHVWLDEGHSYLAMKTFEDGSVIMYSAVATDPSAGWVESGLKALTQLQSGRNNTNKLRQKIIHDLTECDDYV